VVPSEGVTGGSEQAVQQQSSFMGDSRTFSRTQQPEEPQPLSEIEEQAVSTPTIKVSETCGEAEGWKRVTSSTKVPAPPKGL